MLALYDEVTVFGRSGKYKVIEAVEGDINVTLQSMISDEYIDVPWSAIRKANVNLEAYEDYDAVLLVDNDLSIEFMVCGINDRMGLLEVERANGNARNYKAVYYLNTNQVKKMW